MNLASFSIRLIALILDCFFLALLEYLLPINLFYYDILPQSYESTFWEALSNFELLILAPIYFVGLRYWNKGQTFGKKIFGIQTVTESGKELTFVQSCLDCLGYFILPIDLIIGAFLSRKKQRLTQLCSGTIVIENFTNP